MQKKAGQGTFGGRFGGRNPSPETKLMHVRRHLRQPKVSSRDETQPSAALSAAEPCLQRRKSKCSGASFGSRNCLHKGFGGRTFLRRPNLVLPAGQNPALFHANLSPKLTQHAYQLLPTSTYHKTCIKGPKTHL